MKRSDRGAAATELALLAPVFVVLLGVMMAGGRMWLARSAVAEAAGAAARAATLQRSASEAEAMAVRVLDSNLADAAIVCLDRVVTVDTSGFAVPAGSPAAVTVRVRCSVSLSDVLVPGLPGAVDASGVGTSPLDTFRGRR
jgi:Flp pilus assembly protein TadG